MTSKKVTKTVISKPVDIKFKTKSGKFVAFKAFETSLETNKSSHPPRRTSKQSRRKKS